MGIARVWDKQLEAEMKLSEIFSTAWEGLTLNKVRSFLTTLGVIIGVASVIIMLAVSAGAEAAIAEQINGLGANLIIVSPIRGVPGAARTLLLDDAVAIEKQVVGISGVSAEQLPPPQTVKANNVSLDSIPMIGTTSSFLRARLSRCHRTLLIMMRMNVIKVVVLVRGWQRFVWDESPLGQTVTIGTTSSR